MMILAADRTAGQFKQSRTEAQQQPSNKMRGGTGAKVKDYSKENLKPTNNELRPAYNNPLE